MFSKNLKEEGNYFVCGPSRMRFYIPRYYFESSMAQIREDHINTFGVMPVTLVDENGKESEAKILGCAYWIGLYSVNMVTHKNKSFFKDDTPIDYMALDFYPGDNIMKSSVVHSNDNIDVAIKWILGAKVKNFVDMNDIDSMFDQALIMNGVTLNVPHSIKELMIGMLCRDLKEPNRPYGQTLGKTPDASPRLYRAANTREIVARSSVATAIGFEDMDAMIIASLNTTAYGRKQPESPLEKILTM